MIEKRVLPSGRISWRCRTWHRHPGTGKYVERSKSFPTRREAREYEDALRRNRQHTPTNKTQRRIRLTDYYTANTSILRGAVKAKTWKGYERSWRLRILPTLGGLTLTEITPSRIETALHEHWTTTSSPSPTLDALNALSGLMTIAVRDGILVNNPVLSVSRPKPRPGRAMIGLSVGEIDSLAAACKAYDQLWSDVIYLLVYLGAPRWGELAAITTSDIDLDRRTAQINKAISEINGKLTLTTPKSGKARTVPVSGPTTEIIRRLSIGKPPNTPLITGRNGGTLRSTTFRRAVQWPHTVADLGWPGLRPHDLRATGLMIMLQAGLSPAHVQQIAGHSDLKILNHYHRIVKDQTITQAADAISNLYTQNQA